MLLLQVEFQKVITEVSIRLNFFCIINMSLSYSMVNKRFDFAVPLEDIFTNGGIHPRLKFIFQQAYELYLRSHLNIKQTLQEKCLSQCLELKQTIIYANQPAIHSQYSTPSDFFWIIRHFLGLMPISLLPTATSNQKFPWKELSKQCIPFLQCELTGEECQFHCLIARSLNNLPQEHISLLNTLVIFIREISKHKLCKATLKNLAQYYCDAVFLRPFRPGHKIKDQTMLPLFIYIITRWYRIVKYLRIDDAIVLEPDKNCIVNSSTSSQTSRFISEFRDVPYKIVKYLKDVECQTDTTDESEVNVSFTASKLLTNGIDKSVQPVDTFIRDEDVSLKTFTAHLNKGKAPSFVSSLVNIDENEENIECQRCQQFDFSDNVINDRNNNWNEVVQEIARTVTRVEGHNYETDYKCIQPADDLISETSELSDSTFETVTVDTVYDTFKDSTLDGTKTEDSQNTFSFKSIKDINKSDAKTRCQKNDESISFYKSFYKSDEELYHMNGEKSNDFEEDDNNNYNSSNFSLKRFKMKFNFLRTFPPKFKRSNNFRCILAKTIKYKKIRN